MAVRPLRGDPLAVRLLLYARPGAPLDVLYAELAASYREAALRAAPYREWLRSRGTTAEVWVGPCLTAV